METQPHLDLGVLTQDREIDSGRMMIKSDRELTLDKKNTMGASGEQVKW